MGRESGIEWTDATWNPFLGCTKVSPGCRNCYAERIEERYHRDFSKVRRTSNRTFNSPLRWKEPLKIMTCSMSDFFHEDADRWRDDAWEIIRRTPQHTYQILTKRPERIYENLPGVCFWCGMNVKEIHEMPTFQEAAIKSVCGEGILMGDNHHLFWPWPNVWLGTSVEMPKYSGRMETLGKVPAMVHFISAEPLLGPVSIYDAFTALATEEDRKQLLTWEMIDWVIVGGESDPNNPRPMKKEWVTGLRDECVSYNIPFFFKQWGGQVKVDGAWGGRVLDGRTWDEMPVMPVVERP